MGTGVAMVTDIPTAPTTEAHPGVPDIGSAGNRGWRRVTPSGALMALTAVLVATLSARDAAVFLMTSRNPMFATKLAPANATAIVNVFDKVLASGALQQNFTGWLAASKRALRSDPLNAKGLRLIAYVTDMTPNGHQRARRLMQLSERASRRDVLAQLWLIEDAVQRENVPEALKHYDRALSVRPAAGGHLIPVLVSASTEPVIQAALVPYLRANRSWVASFLSLAIAKAPDPLIIARLFQRYGGARAVPSHAELETRMLQRLVQAGKLREAYAFASAAGGAPDTFAFTRAATNERFRPLAWSLYEGGDGDVTLGAQGALSITVQHERKIVAASRIILASAGRKTLRQRVFFHDSTSAPLVTWKAYCRGADGPQRFWTRDLSVAATPMLIEAPLDVPEGCAGLQIDLEVTGAEGYAESKITIDRVAFAR